MPNTTETTFLHSIMSVAESTAPANHMCSNGCDVADITIVPLEHTGGHTLMVCFKALA